MISPEYVRLMAAYTRWQNASLYAAADTLTDAARREDRGAFFGSIHATLDHLLWGDRIWLHRLAGAPAPEASDIPSSVSQHADWGALKAARQLTDEAIAEWAGRVTAEELAGELAWFSGSRGVEVRRPRWALAVQLFNHGTHHRGQVHAMLTAAGAQPEDTDIQYLPAAFYSWPTP
ncbi:MAG TPA: DinB family protein [Pseudomonadales bacterium]